MHEARKRFSLARVTFQPLDESDAGIAGATRVDLHERVELMRAGQIRIDCERAAEGRRCEIGWCGFEGAELGEKPATTAEPGPSRREPGVLGQADPEQLTSLADRNKRSLGR